MKSKNLTLEDIKDVNHCVDTLADLLGFEVTAENRPQIRPAEQGHDSSAYNKKDNVIFISEDDVGNGIAYFEEAAHFMRDSLVPNDGIDSPVDEFFGRLGESLGRQLVKGTDYERLFNGHEPRNFSDLSTHEKQIDVLFEQGEEIEKRFELKTRALVNSFELWQALKDNCINSAKALEAYEKDKDADTLYGSLDQSREEFVAKVKEIGERNALYEGTLNLFGCYAESSKDFYQNIDLTAKFEKVIEEETGEKKEKMKKDASFCLGLAKSALNGMAELVTSCADDLKFQAHIKESEELRVGLQIINLRSHDLGYTCAELYMQQNPNFKEEARELFRRPQEFIAENYMKPEILQPYQAIFEKKAQEKGIPLEQLG